mmetsp:Transcript_25112/g.79249  ORF Transcript_25112/g.79249 Transcript_25112/m.79249 type:complete len:218 (+) Transcript_25112:326-979(+)
MHRRASTVPQASRVPRQAPVQDMASGAIQGPRGPCPRLRLRTSSAVLPAVGQAVPVVPARPLRPPLRCAAAPLLGQADTLLRRYLARARPVPGHAPVPGASRPAVHAPGYSHAVPGGMASSVGCGQGLDTGGEAGGIAAVSVRRANDGRAARDFWNVGPFHRWLRRPRHLLRPAVRFLPRGRRVARHPLGCPRGRRPCRRLPGPHHAPLLPVPRLQL